MILLFEKVLIGRACKVFSDTKVLPGGEEVDCKVLYNNRVSVEVTFAK